MTRPKVGGTQHNWLIDDLAAITSDLKATADAILRNLTRYQETHEERHLTSAALRSAELFQEIARISLVLHEMRRLIDSAKPKSAQADLERIEQELAELRALIDPAAGAEDHD